MMLQQTKIYADITSMINDETLLNPDIGKRMLLTCMASS